MQELSQEAFWRDAGSSEGLDELLTVDELASCLDVRKEKASMLAHWAIGCYRVGNRILVSRKAVDEFLRTVGNKPTGNRY